MLRNLKKIPPVQIFLTPRTAPVVSNTSGAGSSTGGVFTGNLSPTDNVIQSGTRGKLTDAKK